MTKSNSGRKVHISASGSTSQLNAAYGLGPHGWFSTLKAQDHHPRVALPTRLGLPHQTSVKEIPHRLVHRPIRKGPFCFFSRSFPFPNDSGLCQVNIKLGSTNGTYKEAITEMIFLALAKSLCQDGDTSES